LEDTDIDGTVTLKWIFKKSHWKTWNGLTWLKIGTSGGLL